MEYGAEINFNKFHQVIQEYEKLIKELTSDIDVYKSEHEANKTTIYSLVTENKELASRLNEALKVTEKEEIAHIYTENDLIDNQKKQLSTLAKEKEAVVQLWQTALKTVDYLEEELKLFEGRTHGYVPRSEIKKLKANYEEQMESLHNKIDEYNSKLQGTRKICSQEIENKTRQLEKETSQLAEAQNKIKKLELELAQLQEKYSNSEEARNNLQATLAEKSKQVDGFILREEVAKNKVREAVNVVETALMEKDAALLREAHIREELARLSKTLIEAVQEVEAKAKAEISEVTSECQAKLNLLQQELVKAKEEMQNKNFEIEKHVLKQQNLQREIEIIQKGSSQSIEGDMNKLLVLEKNLESTFQKLLLSERKNVQLAAERDGIKADLEQMGAHFERDIKSREIEKQSLEHKNAKLQHELKSSKHDLIETNRRLEQSRKKYEELKKFCKSIKGASRKKLSDIAVANSKAYKQMKKCYEKQVHLTKKWKAEAMAIYKNLGEKIKESHAECGNLKAENYELKDKLSQAESTARKYQQSLQSFCVEVENFVT